MLRTGTVGAAAIALSFGAMQDSLAQQSILSAAGYTGLSVTPTASLLPWGTASFAFDSQVVAGPTAGENYKKFGTNGKNYVAGFGVLPFLEVSGRIASSTQSTNCYFENCGIRDLSFNLKAGTSLDGDDRLKIAVGANDFGGQANFFRTFYGAVTYTPDVFTFTLGYARRSTALIGGTTPLAGAFGSISYQPLKWLESHVEYNDRKAWGGARLLLPESWLPIGWSAHLGANVRIYGRENSSSRGWFSLGLTVPLYKVPIERAARKSVVSFDSPDLRSNANKGNEQELSAETIQEFTANGLDFSTPVPSNSTLNLKSTDENREAMLVIPVRVANEKLQSLAEALRLKGFEDISVGRMASGSIAIRVNNATYNVNTVDGLGVALGVIARQLNEYRVGYRLVLTQRQIPIVGVTGQSDCLSEWIAMRPPRCMAGQLHTPGMGDVGKLLEGAAWIVNAAAPSWATARLILQPVLRTGVATEYGVIDYSVGARITLQQPLWKGGYAELTHISPVANSDDYKARRVFGENRFVSTSEKRLIHQIVRLPIENLFSAEDRELANQWGASALTAHIAAGEISPLYRGAYGEIRWEPFDGAHRFGLEGGRFKRISYYDPVFPIEARSVLGSYRFTYSPTKTDFKITAGQFLYNDKGAQFLVTQRFDDVALNFYIRRSKLSYQSTSKTVAGIELIIPLTPRKDMTPQYHVQVQGTPQWSYGIETKIGSTNFIGGIEGAFPGAAVLDRTFNSDRASINYFDENSARIRSAASN